MKYAIIVLTLSGLLNGCSQIPFEKLFDLTTPDVINYPPDNLKKVAGEMQGGQCPMSNEMIIDYGVMRDQARASKGQKVNIAR